MKAIDKIIYLLGCLALVAVVFLLREIRVILAPNDSVNIYVQPDAVSPDRSHCIENAVYLYCPPKETNDEPK